MIILKYQGKQFAKSNQHITGVPARDLDADDLKQIEESLGYTEADLCKRGLYSKVKPESKKKDTGLTDSPKDE